MQRRTKGRGLGTSASLRPNRTARQLPARRPRAPVDGGRDVAAGAAIRGVRMAWRQAPRTTDQPDERDRSLRVSGRERPARGRWPRHRGARGRHGARRREPPGHRAPPALQGPRPAAARRLPHVSGGSRGAAGLPCVVPPAGARRHGRCAPTPHAVTRLRRGVLDLTRSMLTPSDGRDGFGQLGEAAARHGLAAPSWAPLHRHAVDDYASRSSCSTVRPASSADAARPPATTSSRSARSASSAAATPSEGRRLRRRPRWPRRSARPAASAWPRARPARSARRRRRPGSSGASRRPVRTAAWAAGSSAAVRDDGRLAVMADDVPANRSSEGMLCVKGRFGTGFVHARDRVLHPMVRTDGRWEPRLLGRGARRRRRGAGAEPRALRGARLRQGDQRGRLPHPEVLPRRDGHEQRRSLHAALPLPVGRGDAHVDGLRGHLELVRRLRGGRLPHGRRGRRVREPPGDRHPLPPRHARGARSRRRQSEAHRAVRPGRPLAPAAPRHRRHAVQRDGAGDPRRGSRRREAFIRARTEDFERVASLARGRDARARGGPHRGAGRRHRAGRALVRAAPRSPGSCLIWGMGITQHTNGIHNAHALLNLALVTGQLGIPGAGISPLRGQNNVQGCGDCRAASRRTCPATSASTPRRSTASSALGRAAARRARPGRDRDGRGLSDRRGPRHVRGRREPAPLGARPPSRARRRSPARLPRRPGPLPARDGGARPRVPARGRRSPRRKARSRTPSGACSACGRRSIRRATRGRTGGSRPSWRERVAARSGWTCAAQFDFAVAADIFDEMARLTPFLRGSRTRASTARAGSSGPARRRTIPARRFLYGESFPRGAGGSSRRAQTAEAAELPDPDYPFLLNTGRLLYHWHGGTLTRRVQGLLELAPRLEVAIHPSDARRLGVDRARRSGCASRRGELTGYARLTDAVRPGAVFVPFVKLADSAANFLTNSALDPASKIPEYKVCAVKLEPLTGAH